VSFLLEYPELLVFFIDASLQNQVAFEKGEDFDIVVLICGITSRSCLAMIGIRSSCCGGWPSRCNNI
jgi:hypothetical protein